MTKLKNETFLCNFQTVLFILRALSIWRRLMESNFLEKKKEKENFFIIPHRTLMMLFVFRPSIFGHTRMKSILFCQKMPHSIWWLGGSLKTTKSFPMFFESIHSDWKSTKKSHSKLKIWTFCQIMLTFLFIISWFLPNYSHICFSISLIFPNYAHISFI